MNAPSLKDLVRWAPLAVVVAACSDTTAPDAYVDPEIAFAKGGNGGGKGVQSTVIEPDRLVQVRWEEAEGIARECQINSFEDLDGNDVVRVSSSGTSHEIHVSEHDAFILIREAVAPTVGDVPPHKHQPDGDGISTRWVVTWVGRATWDETAWQTLPDLGLISINSRAQGVLAPVSGDDAVDGAAAILAAVAPDSPESLKVKLADDLANALLGPDDDAVGLINDALAQADAEGTLRGVDCTWQQGIRAFITNDVSYSSTWPKSLRKLFR